MAKANHVDIAEEFDGIGHSMGARSIVFAGLQHQRLFRTALLNEGAGMTGDNLFSMIGRLPNFFQNDLKDADINFVIDGVVYCVKNPIKFLSEGVSVGQANIPGKVIDLGKNGTKVVIFVGLDDSLVSAQRTAQECGENVADLFVVYSKPEADHLFLQKDPVTAALAQLEALDILQKQADGGNQQLREAA